MKTYDPRQADLWSCGIILFVMLVGAFPFEAPTLSDQRFSLVFGGQTKKLLQLWRKNVRDEVLEVLGHLLCPASRRWTARKILSHPWLILEPKSTMNANINSSTKRYSNGTILATDQKLGVPPSRTHTQQAQSDLEQRMRQLQHQRQLAIQQRQTLQLQQYRKQVLRMREPQITPFASPSSSSCDFPHPPSSCSSLDSSTTTPYLSLLSHEKTSTSSLSSSRKPTTTSTSSISSASSITKFPAEAPSSPPPPPPYPPPLPPPSVSLLNYLP